MQKDVNIAVVGAGFTGLAAAQILADLGYKVTLLESSHKLGGLASGFKMPHWKCSLERYYHHWFKSDTCLLDFAKKWKVADQLIWKRPSTVMQTKDLDFSHLDSALALLRYKDLSFLDRIRMGMCLAYLKFSRSWKDFEKVTAESWCIRWMGRDGYEAIWQPLLEGKFGVTLSKKVNMAWLWARLSCRTPQLGTFEGGFQAFADAAGESLKNCGVEILMNTAVTKVDKGEHGSWTINDEVKVFSHVVFCCSPLVVERLLGQKNLNPADLKPQDYLAAQVVILSLKKQVGKHYWYSLRKSGKFPFLALIEHTNFICKSNFADEHLVYLADYVDVSGADWLRSDEDLISKSFEVIQKLNPEITKEDLISKWVFREKYAQPVAGVNHSQHVPSLNIPGMEGLWRASMAHVYPWDRGTNFALELGVRVAKAVGRKGQEL